MQGGLGSHYFLLCQISHNFLLCYISTFVGTALEFR